MKLNDFDNIHCPIAETLDLIGDKWAGLILRDLFLGKSKYSELSESSNITHATLSARLKMLESNQLIVKTPYQTRPERFAYHLTAKGEQLAWLMLALQKVGKQWRAMAENDLTARARDENSEGQSVVSEKNTDKQTESLPYRLINRHTQNPIRLAILDKITGQEISLAEIGVCSEK